MANVKITELTAKTDTAGDDLFLLVDSEDSNREKKLKVSDLGVGSSFTANIDITKDDPVLQLVDTKVAADDASLGSVDFIGKNDAATPEDVVYASIVAESHDVSATSEDGILNVYVPQQGVLKKTIQTDADRTEITANSSNSFFGDRSLTVNTFSTSFRFNPTTFSNFGTISSIRVIDDPVESGDNILRLRGETESTDNTTYGTLDLEVDDDTVSLESGQFVFSPKVAGGGVIDVLNVRSNNIYSANPIRIGNDATANELDDFEQGTWTPTFAGEDSNPSVTSGDYTKIGKVVNCTVKVAFSTVVTNNILQINTSSFPFSKASNTTITGSYFDFVLGANLHGHMIDFTLFDLDGETIRRDAVNGNANFQIIFTYQTTS